MAITNSVLTTSAANVYVSSGNSVISTMYFCNTDTSARTINVFLLSSGNVTANIARQIYSEVQIAANDTFVVDAEKLVLANGDMIQANASVNSVVTATINYVGM